jgi:hypothetical protein
MVVAAAATVLIYRALAAVLRHQSGTPPKWRYWPLDAALIAVIA